MISFICVRLLNNIIVVDEKGVIGVEDISPRKKDQVINIAIHTLEDNKQLLIFNNSKNSSEATAERVALAIENVADKEYLEGLSAKIMKVLSTPTKQCRRLAKCIEKGVAFHHSGLVGKQRTLIEKGFKEGYIKIISSTPTLAAGLDLPAYKVLVKDYKRYSPRGFNDIPVLEYHQMAGRAGRPGFEDHGKSVVYIKDESELDRVVNKYINGRPEEIISKLAVEPTLKMYLLSLISMDVINTREEIESFFANTLYGHQYQDSEGLNRTLFRIIDILKDYSFVIQEDQFYMATSMGRKVSHLYLNPDTANYFLTYFDELKSRFVRENVSKHDLYALIQFICSTMEMRPLFRVNKKEEEEYMQRMEDYADDLIEEYDPFEIDYLSFAQTLKTADILYDWIMEAPEDYIVEKYSITPGELNYKNEVIDWLLYCLEEFSLLKKQYYLKNYFNKLRIRFRNGVKKELISLVSLKGIGRARARKLYNSDIKTHSDIRVCDFSTLSRLLGDKLAISLKEQVLGEKVSDKKLKEKPKEILQREVTDKEVDVIVDHTVSFEREKEKKQQKLTDFF